MNMSVSNNSFPSPIPNDSTPVGEAAPAEKQNPEVFVDSSGPPTKAQEDEAITQVNNLYDAGLITSEDRDFLTAVIQGEAGFPITSGALSALMDLMDSALQSDAKLTVVKFELQQDQHQAKIDAAGDTLDGQIAGFAVTTASSALAFGTMAGRSAWTSFKGVDAKEQDQMMGSAIANTINQLGAGASGVTTAMETHHASVLQADAELLAAVDAAIENNNADKISLR